MITNVPRAVLAFSALLFLLAAPLRAQETPPFIISVSGGLFFPANADYHTTFRSNSDLIWSIGGNFPVERQWFLTGDVAFFSSEAFFTPAMDTSQKLTQRIIHFGAIRKAYLGGALFLRIVGGFNLVAVKHETSGPNSQGSSVEADRKIGYFAGVGIEELLPGQHVSLCGNVVYDYRRVQQSDLMGDFGGVRLVLGLEFILQ